MMTQPSKRVCDSYTEQVQIILNGDINSNQRLFGGRLMQWIDIVAAVVARRHCNCEVTTACVDQLQFKASAFLGNTVILCGRLTSVGRTSMEVRVDTFVESLDGSRSMINRAYLVLVALNADNEPVPVPGLVRITEEDHTEWQAAEKRRLLRAQRRREQY